MSGMVNDSLQFFKKKEKEKEKESLDLIELNSFLCTSPSGLQ